MFHKKLLRCTKNFCANKTNTSHRSYVAHQNYWVRDVLGSEIIKFFYKFSRNELPKSIWSIFNLVHEVHTRNTRNNLLIYIPRMSTSRYGSHSLRGDGASLWNKFFKDFFPSHDLTSFFKLKPFLMKRFLQTYENGL